MATPSLQAIADRLEIEELLSRYAWALDDKRFDGLDDVFTPDAFLDYTATGGEKGSFADIKEWLAKVLPYFPTYQHYVTNKVITIDGDTATSRSALYNPMGQKKGDGTSYFFVGGEYHDQLIRTPNGWRIAERIERSTWADGDVPAAPA
jgi:3-phenylpropionate/cinnamic acid dioxygenase small subunit